ncbi:hypothetical protein V1477_013192 [Vespula maculifrons]|uniref:Uncharacterized protein n=1 Tax=Vespula maculifrons TaxID=7453 RepID=A0ABD2BWQ3_VESMC
MEADWPVEGPHERSESENLVVGRRSNGTPGTSRDRANSANVLLASVWLTLMEGRSLAVINVLRSFFDGAPRVNGLIRYHIGSRPPETVWHC